MDPNDTAQQVDDGAGEEQPDIRSMLESAFEEGDQGEAREGQADGEQTAAPAEDAAAETEEQRGQRERDEAGRFKAKPKAAAAPATPAAPAEGEQGEPKPAAPVVPVPAAQHAKAPQSWKPGLREKWGQLPEDVRAEVVRRETEISRSLQETADVRRRDDAFRATITPYLAFIQAENSNPLQAVDSMMRTAVQLRTAPPQHKADLFATLISQYLGLDDGSMDLLDRALHSRRSGGSQGGAAQGGQQYRDPRVDELLSTIRQTTQQQQQTAREQADSDLKKFAESHEFFADVKDRMAGLMRGGLAKDYEEAYNTACQLDPEIRGVLAQREQAAKAKGASTQRAQRAAKSIRSAHGTDLKPAADGSDLRATIEASFDRSQTR